LKHGAVSPDCALARPRSEPAKAGVSAKGRLREARLLSCNSKASPYHHAHRDAASRGNVTAPWAEFELGQTVARPVAMQTSRASRDIRSRDEVMKSPSLRGIPKAKLPEGTRRQVTSKHLPCGLYPAYHALLANQINGSGRHSSAVQLFLIALQPALAASASHARFMVSATAMAAATPALGQEANNKGTKLAMSMRLRTSSCGHGTLGICFGCCISNPGLPQAARRTRPSPTSPFDRSDVALSPIDRGGSSGLVWTDQGNVLHGPTHITYGCATAQHLQEQLPA